MDPSAAVMLDSAPLSASADFPRDADGFVRALLASRYETLRVEYDVTGPAGMTGTLEILQRAGGARRESWSLELPLPGEDDDSPASPLLVEGSRVVTTDRVWSCALILPGLITW